MEWGSYVDGREIDRFGVVCDVVGQIGLVGGEMDCGMNGKNEMRTLLNLRISLTNPTNASSMLIRCLRAVSVSDKHKNIP